MEEIKEKVINEFLNTRKHIKNIARENNLSIEEIYDIFYDGLLDDAYDSVPYEKWLDARSNEYEWWLDSRSECYEIWLDARSDIYEFWLDLRSATFEKDVDEANEIIADFKPTFQNKEEYFAFLEDMYSDGDRITYNEDGTAEIRL